MITIPAVSDVLVDHSAVIIMLEEKWYLQMLKSGECIARSECKMYIYIYIL